jgi:hypothetical protein
VGHNQKNLDEQQQPDDILAFRQFRCSVLRFLKLPLDVSESELRDALNAISPNLLAVYKQRSTQATLTWASRCRTDLQSLRQRDPSDKNASAASPSHPSDFVKSVAAAS